MRDTSHVRLRFTTPEPRAMQFIFPQKVHILERDSTFLYFSADQGSGVVVNQAGREVLEVVRYEPTLPGILAKLGPERVDSEAPAQIRAFLEQMVNKGFLTTAAIKQDSQAETSPPIAPPPPLTHLYLHLTDRCNLRCIYCYNKTQRTTPKDSNELTTAEIIDLLETGGAAGVETVVFTGGEPLLRSDIFLLADHARKLGMHTSLLTNGSLISGDNAASIARNFINVIVSLDSWKEEEYNSLRPGGSFQSVWTGLQLLSSAGVEDLAIRPVITRVNLESLPEFPKKASKELGCTTFYPALYLPNSISELNELQLFPDSSTYWKAMDDFSRALATEGCVSRKEQASLAHSGACGAGSGLLSIAPDGEVYPCQSLHYPEFLLGNLRQSSITEIHTNSEVLKTFRNNHWPWFSRCGDCPLLSICSATCRVFFRSFQDNPDIFFDHLCPFFQQECETKLWQEATRSPITSSVCS